LQLKSLFEIIGNSSDDHVKSISLIYDSCTLEREFKLEVEFIQKYVEENFEGWFSKDTNSNISVQDLMTKGIRPFNQACSIEQNFINFAAKYL
jgi:hypothetical protein